MTRMRKKPRKKAFLPAQVEGLARHGRILLGELQSRLQAPPEGLETINMKRKIKRSNRAPFPTFSSSLWSIHLLVYDLIPVLTDLKALGVIWDDERKQQCEA